MIHVSDLAVDSSWASVDGQLDGSQRLSRDAAMEGSRSFALEEPLHVKHSDFTPWRSPSASYDLLCLGAAGAVQPTMRCFEEVIGGFLEQPLGLTIPRMYCSYRVLLFTP